MDGDQSKTGFLDYPKPKAHDIPYKAKPQLKNPVLKGLPLHYLASVLATVPFLPWLFWNNAGFSGLRQRRELDQVEARYDPTVTPTSRSGDEDGGNYTHLAHLEALSAPSSDVPGRFYTILDFHNAYKKGDITPTDVIEKLLPLIRRDITSRTKHSTAFVDSKVDLVRAAAEASTKRYQEGKPLGVLDGVPFAVKDESDIRGYKTYYGAKTCRSDGKDVETSWYVKKLEEEGAVMVGKTNMHELGMDTTSNNPIWGTPLNPYNEGHYCGGSSGGSAYTVASGIVPFAFGTDGGGSVRIPANYCGIYGLKTSHGRVSKSPLMSHLNTTTVTGPLAATMADLTIAYRVMAKPDPSNASSSRFPFPKPPSTPPKKVIGICKPWLDRADPVIQEALQAFLHYLTTAQDYKFVEISLPLLHEGQMAHAMTILNECIASQTANPESNLTPANRILLAVGKQTPAYDLILAQRVRNLIMQHLSHLFHTHPGLIILYPTTPNLAWDIRKGELEYGVTDAERQVRSMEYAWMANFTGLPCLQFPVGYAGDNLPVGVSAMGEWGEEEELLRFGFVGEEYLGNGSGRRRPRVWVDVLGGEGV